MGGGEEVVDVGAVVWALAPVAPGEAARFVDHEVAAELTRVFAGPADAPPLAAPLGMNCIELEWLLCVSEPSVPRDAEDLAKRLRELSESERALAWLRTELLVQNG